MAGSRRLALGLALTLAVWNFGRVAAQGDVVDRVVARVNGQAITLSDARLALGLGMVQVPPGSDPILAATRVLVQRQLLLAEVTRFMPPEPDPDLLAGELTSLRARAGSPADYQALVRDTGIDEARLRELARDTLRIQAYLGQRFGGTGQGQSMEEWIQDLRRRANVSCRVPGC